MEKKVVMQAGLVGALSAFVSTLIMGFGVSVPESGIDLQPSLAYGPVDQFVYPINQFPGAALRFYAADSMFVLSYLMVFAALYQTTSFRSRLFAGIGLGAGILTALFDAGENALLISYASSALNGVPLTEPALPLIYVLANLKWTAAFAAMYAFGLVWPRQDRLGWILTGLMLLFPIIGVLGLISADLVPVRGLFFLLGMPLFAWHFWIQTRARQDASS
jgi:hypothetical protein